MGAVRVETARGVVLLLLDLPQDTQTNPRVSVLTLDDVEIQLDVERAQPTEISGHRISRGPGGTMSVQVETRWRGHRQPTWESETNVQQTMILSSGIG